MLATVPAPRVLALQGSVPLGDDGAVRRLPGVDGLSALAVAAPPGRPALALELRGRAPLRRRDRVALRAGRREPILVGHSQGGMMVIKTLHLLAQRALDIPVWESRHRRAGSAYQRHRPTQRPSASGRRVAHPVRRGARHRLASPTAARPVGHAADPARRAHSVVDFSGFSIPWARSPDRATADAVRSRPPARPTSATWCCRELRPHRPAQRRPSRARPRHARVDRGLAAGGGAGPAARGGRHDEPARRRRSLVQHQAPLVRSGALDDRAREAADRDGRRGSTSSSAPRRAGASCTRTAPRMIATPAALDEPRPRATIAGVLEDCGLTGFESTRAAPVGVPRGRGGARPRGAPVGWRSVRSAGDQIRASINRPFPASGAYDPFRFFAIADNDRCLLGVVYDHLVAGGDSIAVLVTDIAARYVAAHPGEVPSRTSRCPGIPAVRCSCDGRARCWRAAGAAPAGGPSANRGMRPLADEGDGRNGFVHFAVDAAPYGRLREAAASVSRPTTCCSPSSSRPLRRSAGKRDPARRRHAIAVASIVNLRDDFQPPPDRVFGQFRSSFRVVHAFPEGTTLATLARDVGAQAGRSGASACTTSRFSPWGWPRRSGATHRCRGASGSI